VGAQTAALALHALAEILELARVGRLTRSQHVLLRFGELITYAECAAALARRAASAASGELHVKADRRFDAPALAAISRVFAREAALKVADEGLRWVRGASAPDADLSGLESALGLPAVREAQAGLLADMDVVADAAYRRTTTT
jgi:alkylation response protein AidB-like acyl-CoA dehydrogenase